MLAGFDAFVVKRGHFEFVLLLEQHYIMHLFQILFCWSRFIIFYRKGNCVMH